MIFTNPNSSDTIEQQAEADLSQAILDNLSIDCTGKKNRLTAKYHLPDGREVILQGYVSEPSFVLNPENKICRVLGYGMNGNFSFEKDEKGALFTLTVEDEK